MRRRCAGWLQSLQMEPLLFSRRAKIALASVLCAAAMTATVEHSGLTHDELDEVAASCAAAFGAACLTTLGLRRLTPPQMTATVPLPRHPQPSTPLPPTVAAAMSRDGPSQLQVSRR